jgi:four helix bundle protein
MGGSEINSYRDLKVWQEGISLAKTCYEISRCFPKEELFGLTSQIRRAAVSVPANIAEGHGRECTGDFVRFLRVAQGSLKELETHLIIATETQICSNDHISPVLTKSDQLGRMIRGLIRSLQART